MKTCGRCKQTLEEDHFYWKGKDKIDRFSYCKSCYNKYCAERWVRIKKEAVEWMGGACQDCKGRFHYSVYEFHHLDPQEKEMTWTKMRLTSKAKRVAELEKCVMLCANCHRLRHHQYQ